MSGKTLEGRIALITGASRGLGKSMALALAGDGARIALVARDAAKLEETAAAIRGLGGDAQIFNADVTSEQRVADLAREVEARLGRVQILINNAGVNVRKRLTEFTFDEWRYVTD